MSDITVTFTASNSNDLLQQMEAFVRGVKASDQPKPEVPKSTPSVTPVTPAAGPDESIKTPEKEAPVEDKPVYTMEQIRAEAMALKNPEKVREILLSLGVTCISKAPEEIYPELMAKIKEAS